MITDINKKLRYKTWIDLYASKVAKDCDISVIQLAKVLNKINEVNDLCEFTEVADYVAETIISETKQLS
jgi:hypothetical protein